MTEPTSTETEADVVERVLARQAAESAVVTRFGAGSAQALGAGDLDQHDHRNSDGDQFDREDREALRRVAGLSTELEDVTEVEYRQVRLEKVVLIGIYTQGNVVDAENSMR